MVFKEVFTLGTGVESQSFLTNSMIDAGGAFVGDEGSAETPNPTPP